MAQPRRILIADPDVSAVRALTRALRARGYQVQHAADGSKALEVSVLRHPEVILFDELCALIDARSFVQILQTNPRTADIPVVVTTGSRHLDRLRQFREGVLQKPFNVDEVLARIDHLCRRAETAKQLKGDAREIEGGLAQLPLADLLQILSMNRRTGRLVLTQGPDRGEVHLASGRPANARAGDIEGEKALFRLLGWKEGTFAFQAGPPPSKVTIDRAMEDALLEGMRQVDERARLLGALPALRQVLALVAEAVPPIDPHPVMREILRVLAQPRRLAEVLDLAEAPDLDVLGSLTTMLEKGLVQAVEEDANEAPALLGTAEVHALRGRLMRGRPARHALVAKVVLGASGPKAGRWFLRSTAGLLASSNDPACLRSSFGTLGQLEVSEALKVDFVLVPTAEAARPLWRPFLASALGALMLEDSEAVMKLARFCAFDLRLPTVLASGPASGLHATARGVPPSLRGAPVGVVSVDTDISAAIRTLLVISLQPPQGDPTTTEGEGSFAPGPR